jgi:hypothetical protein
VILESQVRALDTAIQNLDRQISDSKEPRVNEPFRESWRAYTTRWSIQRDEWLGAGSLTRKFGFSESVYNQFREAFLKWQTDYQKRIVGTAAAPPPAKAPTPETSPLFGGFFAGTGTTLVWAALIIGGIWFINKNRRGNNGQTP